MSDREIPVVLPEGATVLERVPVEPSIELALEVARLGASDEAILALGGEEALVILDREREAEAAGNGSASAQTNGQH